MSSNVEVLKCAALFAHSIIVKDNKTKEKYVFFLHIWLKLEWLMSGFLVCQLELMQFFSFSLVKVN